jgi:hypothetical protein
MSSKISLLTDGTPAQGSDILPVARSGTNRRITVDDVKTYIAAPSSPIPITRDDARLAVLGTAGAKFNAGQMYVVNNAMAQVAGVTIDCQIWLIAETEHRLATRGTGLFKNSVMGAQMPMAMDYTLNVSGSDDFISYMYQSVFNNTLTFKDNYTSIDKFFLDTGNFYDNTWNDAIATALADTTISNSTFGYNANVSIADLAVFSQSDLGAGATLSLYGTQALFDCEIGAGETLNATSIDSAYTQTGKKLGGGVSTFECAVANNFSVRDNSVLNIAAMPDGGDYSFCGIFSGITTTTNYNFDNIITNLTSHNYIFQYNGGSGIVQFINGIGFRTNGGSALNMFVSGDFVEITYNNTISGWGVKTSLIQTPVGTSAAITTADLIGKTATFNTQGILISYS